MRFFLSILGVIIFVVVAIVIIASTGSSTPKVKPIVVTDYGNAGNSVTQTTTGILIGNEQRQAIRVTVNNTERDIYLLNTYDQTIINSETFPNTSAAYNTFLGALQNAGFSNSRRSNLTNIYGVCPLGNTYQYELTSPTKTVFNNWSTSCNSSQGTFAGNGPLIRQLFSLQIPNYNSFIQPANNINNFIF
jgi:hypothetical protein